MASHTSAHDGQGEHIHLTLENLAQIMCIDCGLLEFLWDKSKATAAYLQACVPSKGSKQDTIWTPLWPEARPFAFVGIGLGWLWSKFKDLPVLPLSDSLYYQIIPREVHRTEGHWYGRLAGCCHYLEFIKHRPFLYFFYPWLTFCECSSAPTTYQNHYWGCSWCWGCNTKEWAEVEEECQSGCLHQNWRPYSGSWCTCFICGCIEWHHSWWCGWSGSWFNSWHLFWSVQHWCFDRLTWYGRPLCSFKEAMASPEHQLWEDVCKEEFESLKELCHPSYRCASWSKGPLWKMGPLSQTKKEGKPVRYKAWYAFWGCGQIPGCDYNWTTSPTACFESFWILLHLAGLLNWDIQQFNIKTAFLHGLLDKEEFQFMDQLEGFKEPGKEDWVWHVEKGLYRMHQAGQVWNCTLDKAMVTDWGFTHLPCEYCIYYHQDEHYCGSCGQLPLYHQL